MFLGIIILVIAFHAALFVRLGRRVSVGSISRGKAVGLYALLGLGPTVLFVGSFLILAGAEEFLSVAVISEGFARLVPIIGGLLLLLWILCCVVFTLNSWWTRRLRE